MRLGANGEEPRQLLTALEFDKDPTHRGRTDNPRALVTLHIEEDLVTCHDKPGLADFGEVAAEEGQITDSSCERFRRADAESGTKVRPRRYIEEFGNERLATDKRESPALPRIEEFCRNTCWRKKRGEQDVRVQDETHHGRCALLVAFRADVLDCLVDQLLQIVWRDVSEVRAGFLDGLMKNPPANSFFNERGEIAFFHPLVVQIGAQGMIGVI